MRKSNFDYMDFDKFFSSLMDKNSDKFPNWINAFNELSKYNSFSFEESNTSEDLERIFNNVASVLGEISDVAIKFGKYKDTFDNTQMSIYRHGPSVIVLSLKMGTEFYFGADDLGVYISTSLRNFENVNYMDDTFWNRFLSLSELGHFELEGGERHSRKTREKYSNIFSSHKSKIFSLLRNYFVSTTEKEPYMITESLRITWTSGYTIEHILFNCCKAFKILYNLNYALWKVSDLKQKSK